MPQVSLKVSWPDNTMSEHVSPSTIIKSYFEVDSEIPLEDFLAQAEKAFNHASDRVKERFGFHCSQASSTLESIKSQAANQSSGNVHILSLEVIQ